MQTDATLDWLWLLEMWLPAHRATLDTRTPPSNESDWMLTDCSDCLGLTTTSLR